MLELVLQNTKTNNICTIRLADDFAESLEDINIHSNFQLYTINRVQTASDKISALMEKFGQKYAYVVAEKYTNIENNTIASQDNLRSEIEQILRKDNEFKALLESDQYKYIMQTLTMCALTTSHGIIAFDKILKKDNETKRYDSIYIEYIQRYIDMLSTPISTLPFTALITQLSDTTRVSLLHPEIYHLQYSIRNALGDLLTLSSKSGITNERDEQLRTTAVDNMKKLLAYCFDIEKNIKQNPERITHKFCMESIREVFLDQYKITKEHFTTGTNKIPEQLITYIENETIPKLQNIILIMYLDTKIVTPEHDYSAILTKYAEMVLYMQDTLAKKAYLGLIQITKTFNTHAIIIEKLLNKTYDLKRFLEGEYNDDLDHLTQLLNNKGM